MLITVLILITLTVAVITMVGALLQLSALLPDEPLLKIFSRYLAEGDRSGRMLTPLEAREKLVSLRKRIFIFVVVTLMVVALTAAISSIWSWNVGGPLTAIGLSLALNGLVIAGMLSLWSRRLKKMPFDTFAEFTFLDTTSPSKQD